jgi:hypothetical protein
MYPRHKLLDVIYIIIMDLVVYIRILAARPSDQPTIWTPVIAAELKDGLCCAWIGIPHLGAGTGVRK